ncbi:hypothetical protein CEE39_08110 [bacterium (candidate division B38) B3_B38]|nr:MAG: hypothetical protein CEE39_08110 [bacterium (candidate division B38) B3_B38]
MAYEGWSGLCVNKAFDPAKSDEENEDSYYKFAEAQSCVVIKKWIVEYKDHHLINCGHLPSALYGVTWALFKKCNK